MSVKSDKWILRMCREQQLIAPFEDKLIREVNGRRIISAGLSSYGYDLRLAPDGFRVFSPIASVEIEPIQAKPACRAFLRLAIFLFLYSNHKIGSIVCRVVIGSIRCRFATRDASSHKLSPRVWP